MPDKFPARERPVIGLGRLWVGEEERALVERVLASRDLNRFYVSGDSMAAALEEELAGLVGVRHALAVTSGSGALVCALAALGVGPGDEVLVPAWSWVACFSSVVLLGARPVLVEVDESLCFDPAEIARKATARTKAAMVIHFQGVAADMESILGAARERGIRVLEDCAQSPGALYHGRRVGSMGDIGIYSFQNQKTITSGEGGAVLTDDPELFERAVRMHDLGMYRPVFEQRQPAGGEQFSGGQFRMSELTAAVARAQLARLDRIREHCRRVRDVFLEALGAPQGLRRRTVHDPAGDSGIEEYFFLDPGIDGATLRGRLEERNVNTLPMTGTYCHYSKEYCAKGLAHHPDASPFRELGPMPTEGYRAEDFPRTEALVGNMLSLPFGVAYTEEDGRYMAGCLLEELAALA